MVDVKELKDNHPDSALLLNVNDEKLPDLSALSYKSVPVHDVKVGSFILVGTGEVCDVMKCCFLTVRECSNLVNNISDKIEISVKRTEASLLTVLAHDF